MALQGLEMWKKTNMKMCKRKVIMINRTRSLRARLILTISLLLFEVFFKNNSHRPVQV